MLNLKNVLLAASAASITAIAMFWASPTFAFEDTSRVTITIDQRDLETDRGVERVWYQLSRKAERSCGSSRVTGLNVARAAEVCTRNLLESFIDDVDNTALRSYHLAHREQ